VYLRTVLCVVLMSLSLSLPHSLAWEQSLKNGISTYKLSDFQSGKIESCPSIQGVLGNKLYKKGTKAYVPLTDSEYIELAGSDVDYIGLAGGTLFYSRESGRLVGPSQIYMVESGYDLKDASIYSNPNILAKIENASRGDIVGDFPVLCGDGGAEKAMVAKAKIRVKEAADRAAEKVEFEKTCELCTIAGGYYLQAIYDGNFDKQNALAGDYLGQIAASGGDEAMAHGVIINSLSAKGNNFTFLEDALGYYLLATSREWPKQCFGPSSTEVTFTTTYPEQVYETLGGVSMGSDAAVRRTTKYIIKPEFDTACNSMCNKNGGILLTARIAGASEAIDVYRGISELLRTHDCDSEIVHQFERNLLEMWRQEKAQPRNARRNSIGNYWRK